MTAFMLDPGTVWSYFTTYVLPYIPILVVLLVAVAFGNSIGERKATDMQKRALKDELITNLSQARAILEFVEKQTAGEPYVNPIPRFHRSAYEQLRNSGRLRSLKRGVREEIETVYEAIYGVEAASDRQEELLGGAAATSPIAPEIRAQNLTYIRDTIANLVLPRLEQFETFTRR